MRLKLLFVTLFCLIFCLQISSSYASKLVATNADKLRVFEIIAMLEDDEYQTIFRGSVFGSIPTQEMLDAMEEANPKLRERRLMIAELNELVKKDYPLEFMISLIKMHRTEELYLNPVIVRVINEESIYADELMFELLTEMNLLTDPRDKGTGADCIKYENYCHTVVETFIKRGNVPSYIENFMLKNNYMNDRHLGKVSSQMDYYIIEKEITELLFWASENNNHILNNRLSSLAANSFLWKFHTVIKDNPKMPNPGYSPYPEWYKDIDTTIVDLRLIQAELEAY